MKCNRLSALGMQYFSLPVTLRFDLDKYLQTGILFRVYVGNLVTQACFLF
jgi:hypothetical protein